MPRRCGAARRSTALLIQNTNPVSVAPDQEVVKRGFAREDLFTVVHEQVMTDTARMADLVLPATMFVEHDDIYQAGGQQHILLGPKLDRPARRVPQQSRGDRRPRPAPRRRPSRLRDDAARADRPHAARLAAAARWRSSRRAAGSTASIPFEKAHFLDGFGWPDGKFRLRADWSKNPYPSPAKFGPVAEMPSFPDHWEAIETADEEHPFRLATSPARNFLNSSFTETPTSLAKEERPTVLVHPDDAARRGIAEGDSSSCATGAAPFVCTPGCSPGCRRGVLVAESIWPNDAYEDGRGINTLTGADAPAPAGGAAFHDNSVRLSKVAAEAPRHREEMLASG